MKGYSGDDADVSALRVQVFVAGKSKDQETCYGTKYDSDFQVGMYLAYLLFWRAGSDISRSMDGFVERL